MELTALQKKVVEHLRTHPNATSTSIGSALRANKGSVSAALSTITKNAPGFLRREKVVRTGRYGGTKFSYSINGTIPPLGKIEEPRKVRPYTKGRRVAAKESAVDVLLTLKVGKRESLTVTIAEARDLLRHLLALQRFFGESS